jgi:hypothetical protein
MPMLGTSTSGQMRANGFDRACRAELPFCDAVLGKSRRH